MNIREVIEKLQQVAADLPDGLDSDVEIHICNGHDAPGLSTTSVEVHPAWLMDDEMRTTERSWARIQGHPHLDEGSGETMPLTAGIDDLVEKWATEQEAGESSASKEIIRVKTDDEEYVLLPFSEGTYIKLPYVGGIPLLPGAANAVNAGCTCDPERNNYGRGYQWKDDGVEMVIKDDCPVHLRVEGPVDPDQQTQS